MTCQPQGSKPCDFSPRCPGGLLEVLYSLPFLLRQQVPRTLMSQAGFPPCLGKPGGLCTREPPASSCHPPSVISGCLAGGPRLLQPQPRPLSSRAISHWILPFVGRQQQTGLLGSAHPQPPPHFSTLLHTPPPRIVLSKPSCGRCPCKLLCVGSRGFSPHPLLLSFLSSPNRVTCPTPRISQASWPCKCPSCPMKCHLTDTSSSPSSHPKSKPSLPGSPP